MSNSIKKIAWAIAAFIVLCVGLKIYMCNTNFNLGEGSEIKTVIVPGDAKPITSKEYIPQIGKTVYVEIPVDVDSAKIIADYYAVRENSDTLRNDSSLFVVVNDKVGQNRILGRTFTIQNKRPMVVLNTTIKPVSKFQLYGGVFGGYSPRSKSIMVGPQLTAIVNNSVAVGYGYDITGNSHIVNFQMRLTGRRK